MRSIIRNFFAHFFAIMTENKITAEMLAEIAREEGPARCPWNPENKDQKSPHVHIPVTPKKAIMSTILDNIGNTPLVRINKIAASEGIQCELLAKCEFFNSGGSVKDRIGLRMVMDAQNSGRIKKGDTLIEATSGNTGIGMALAAAILGYRMIITLPEKMSKEKVDVLKALGAEIIRTPTEAAFDSPESHIGVAKRLNAEIPNSHILDQYSNPSNPLAHYDGTGQEILDACENKVDAIVLSVGTGGTLTGIARKFREKCPTCEIVGVDPHGSILALPGSLNTVLSSYKVEGIGYDFIPRVLDRKLVDTWIKTNDTDSFAMGRRLIREEGLLCGGSAGATMWAAVQVAKRYGPGKRVVVLLADSVRNYMTKFLSDDWMVENGFMADNTLIATEWWHGRQTADLKLQTPVTCAPDLTCSQAVDILATQGYDQLPVVDSKGAVVGMVTTGNLQSFLGSGRVRGSDPVSNALFKQYATVNQATTLQKLSRIFENHHYAVVIATQKRFVSGGGTEETQVVVGVATRIDLVKYMASAARS